MFNLAKFRLRRNNESGWMIWLGLIVVTWSALLAGSLVWDMHQLKQDTLNAATVAARANINKDKSFRKWAATHGGVYVPPTEHTPSNPYLKVPDRDVVTTTGKKLTLMNPAYMLRQLQADFPGEYGTRSHITSLNPLNPNNAPDDWEAKALHAFEQGSKELLEAQQIDGQPYLRMMLPMIVEQGCLKCHAQQGYKLGDIRGGISSAVPLASFLAREREANTGMMLNHGAIWLLGLAGLTWLGVSFRRVQRLEILAHSVAAVEESERRFRAIAQSANDAIISADSAGKVVGWNPGAERLFGYAKAEIIGQPLTVLIPERFRNLHSAGLARVVAGGAPHVIGKTVELAGLRKDGSEFPLEFSLAQWQAAEGQFFTAIIRDITERKLKTDELKENEQRYRTLADSGQALIWTAGTDKLCNYFNAVWLSFTGRSLEQEMGNGWAEGVHPDDFQRCLNTYVTAFDRREKFSMDYRLRHHDGEYRWLQDEGCPRYNSAGEFIGYIGYCLDITERKQAEISLRESRDMIMKLTSQVPGVVYQYRLYADGRSCFPFASSGMNDIYELTPEEVLDDATSVFGRLHPDDYDRVATTINESAQTLKIFHCEFRVMLPRQGLRWRLSNASPERLEDGSTLWHGVISDITERKQAEDSLRKLSLAVEQSPSSIIITDLDANIEFANAAFVDATGYSLAEVIGQNPRLLHSGKTPRATYDDLWAHLTRGELWKGEFTNRRKDGSEYIEAVLISPVRQPDGRVTNYLAIKEDITERKQVESQLAEQLNELRRWHDVTSGREKRILDLKHEVNELLVQAGQPPRYPSAETPDPSQNSTGVS